MVLAGLLSFVGLGMTVKNSTPDKPVWKNLKVMPKNTDEEQKEVIMHRYSVQLGVTCSFCHPDTRPGVFPRRVDFVTDEKPEKRIARDMMRMTDRINKKYFDYTNDYSHESLAKEVVTCGTCHRGITKPSNMKLFNRD